jgi:peptide/nickel transport system substrate-binding protein
MIQSILSIFKERKVVFMRKLSIFVVVLILVLSVSVVLGQATTTTYPQPSEYGPGILNWGSNVKYGGTYTFLNTAPYSYSLNPFSTVALPSVGLIYEPLMYMSPDGNVTYLLATSYKWINDTTLETTIRKNVRWTDGVPFTPEDVVFTFNYVKEHPSIDTNAIWASTNHLQSVSASGDNVYFKFTQPSYAALPYIISQQIVPEHIWSKITDPSKDVNLNPIGTGPFIFKSFNQANQVAEYVKNPNYWMEGRPYVDKVIMKGTFGGNEAATLALIKHEGDVAQIYIPDIGKAYVDKDPQNNKFWWPVMGNNYLITNDTEYPFSIPEFRKALSMAMDRQFIVLSDYGKDLQNYENPTMIPLPQISWMDPTLTSLASSLVAYNPKGAQELLASIGFKKNAQGLLTGPDGKVLPAYTIKVVAGWTDWITGAQILVDEFKEIGLRVSVDQESFGAFYSDLQNGNFDMTVVGYYATTPNPYAMYFSALSSDQTAPIGKPAIGNFCRYTNPLIDDALNVFNSYSNPRIQRQAIYTIERIVLDDMPIIPFLPGPFWYEYQTQTLTGFPNAEHPYTYVLAGIPQELIALNVHLK